MTKKLLSVLLSALMIAAMLAGCAGQGGEATPTSAPTDPTEPKPAIAQIVIGTTSVIEAATRGEYAFDMLASGVSELPLLYQDTVGSYHPLLAYFAT